MEALTASSNSVIDILGWVEQTTFQIMHVALFGSDLSTTSHSLDELLQEFHEAFSISSGLNAEAEMALETILPAHVFFGLIPLDHVRRTKESMHKIRSYCKQQIVHRREQNTEVSRVLTDKDILDTAIRTEHLNDEEILDMCTTFLAIGYKATSVAISWAVYYLSIKPSVQALLRTEIRASFPAPGQVGAAPFTAAMLEKLPVLTAVCNETLRFAPLVHLTYREARADTLLCGSGRVVPEGTILTISPWAIQRSPVYWRGGDPSDKPSSASHTPYPSPTQWDPMRWLADKEGGARMRYSFIPFGRGPRCCVAEAFARDEMAILIATLVARFDLSFKTSGRDLNPDAEQLRISFGLTAKPVKLMIRAQPVDGW